MNPVQLRDLNVLLEKNQTLKVDRDWHKVQNKILPLKYERGELETKKTYLSGLKEAEDPQVIEQIEACEDGMEVIDMQVKELLKKEDKLLEDGTWLQRKLDKLRTSMLTYVGVNKAVKHMKHKAETQGPTIEEERTAINEQLSELQERFLLPEALKWKPDYRKRMEAQVRELKLKQTQIRSKERSLVAKMQLEKQMKLQVCVSAGKVVFFLYWVHLFAMYEFPCEIWLHCHLDLFLLLLLLLCLCMSECMRERGYVFRMIYTVRSQ